MGNRTDFRFIVGTKGGPHSAIWRVWSRRDDVYACSATSGGVEKFSFHPPNIWRHASTKEHANARGTKDRYAHQWAGPPMPPAGSGQVLCPLIGSFPTDFLSTSPLASSNKPIIWLPEAPQGHSRIVRLLMTYESESEVQSACVKATCLLIGYSRLADGRAIALVTHTAEFHADDFRVPASHHEGRDLVVSRRDPSSSGRPVTFRMFRPPPDGDAAEFIEYGAYWEPHTPNAAEPGIFKRAVVFDRAQASGSEQDRTKVS